MDTSPQLCPHSLNILLVPQLYIFKAEIVKLDMVMYSFNLTKREVEVGASEAQGHPQLASEFKANVKYQRHLLPKRNENLTACHCIPHHINSSSLSVSPVHILQPSLCELSHSPQPSVCQPRTHTSAFSVCESSHSAFCVSSVAQFS